MGIFSVLEMVSAAFVLMAITGLWILLVMVDVFRKLRVLSLFDTRHKANERT